MKIDQIEAVILTFEVLGSKWNFLLPGTSFLPGTSLVLPTGDVGCEINSMMSLSLIFPNVGFKKRLYSMSLFSPLNVDVS